ncbi:Mbov_0400 family ICE element protein [Mycoplasmopsis cynos]|uniref:Mbov_0400 family ICE element protein n=1 Tax=Mycoplasmopsis cynos TaxID=171284 RepID=UPI0030CD0D74
MLKNKNNLKVKMLETKKSIIFDRFETQIDFHPVIVFSDYFGNLYYLKARSVYDQYGNFKQPINNEILITKHKKGLPSKDSYVDLTQIFKISEEDFEKIFDDESAIYLHSSQLSHTDITRIYNGLSENLSQEPPKVSISFVFEDDDKKFKSYLIYSDENLLNDELRRLSKNSNNNLRYEEFINDVIQNRNTDKDFLNEVENIKLSINSELKYYALALRDNMLNKSIVFSELEEKEEDEALILCDSNNEKYYLSMRNTLNHWGQEYRLNDNHILVTINKDNNKVQKFINTSSIFKISEKDFKNFNKNEIIYLSSDSFVKEDIEKVVNKVNENIENNLNISFIEVTKSEDKNELEAKNLYSSKEKLKLLEVIICVKDFYSFFCF